MTTNKKIFHAKSTALEVVEGYDLNGFKVIVTGATSGIGKETARALAKVGAHVVIGARDLEKAEQVVKELRQDTQNEEIYVEKLELDSLKSVKDFCERYSKRSNQLDILVLNAGISACPLGYTKDGFELQFGTNYMGHFALTVGLLPLLEEAARKSTNGRKSRVVSVSSGAHLFSDIEFDDINYKHREYERFAAYGQSKTANALLAVALTKLYEKNGIVSNAVMPGSIMSGLQKFLTDEDKKNFGWVNESGKINEEFKTTEQGASTSVWAAIASELEGVGAKYLEDCRISDECTKEKLFAEHVGYLKYALDEENAIKLWKVSLEWLEKPPI